MIPGSWIPTFDRFGISLIGSAVCEGIHVQIQHELANKKRGSEMTVDGARRGCGIGCVLAVYSMMDERISLLTSTYLDKWRLRFVGCFSGLAHNFSVFGVSVYVVGSHFRQEEDIAGIRQAGRKNRTLKHGYMVLGGMSGVGNGLGFHRRWSSRSGLIERASGYEL